MKLGILERQRVRTWLMSAYDAVAQVNPRAPALVQRCCRRLARAGDEKIKTYCDWSDTDLISLLPPTPDIDETNTQGTTTSGDTDTSHELCMTPPQWESYDRQAQGTAKASGGKETLAVDAEVIVSATRTLAAMRKQILVAEDRFLAKYNSLNQVREFDVVCHDEAPTGSRLRVRSCRPKFIDKALEHEVQGKAGLTRAATIMASKRDPFRKNMISLAAGNADLASLAQERADLENQYNRVLRRAFGAKD